MQTNISLPNSSELNKAFGDERLPLHHRLREDLLRKIEEGSWAYGVPLPSEAALAANYGVALGTMRSAIGSLVRDGILERHQGRGTFLRKPDFNYSLFRLFRCELPEGRQLVPESRILDRKELRAAPHIAAQLLCEVGAPVISLSRLRLCNGEPLLVEEIWLPMAGFEPLLNISLTELGPLLYSEYERLCNCIVVSAKERLSVATASADVAQVLDLTIGAPVVVIDRLAFGQGGVRLEWRRSHGRADRFNYEIEIR